MPARISARTRSLLSTSDLEVMLPRLAEAGGWAGVFGVDTDLPVPITLEIGIGKDPHIIERAAAAPDAFFVGIEHSKKKLEKVHAKAIRRRVRNLRLVRADAFRVIDALFPDDSLTGAYLLFPDPWPKKRHHKNRLVQTSLMAMLARKLVAGSHLELRTDHGEYREQMVEVMAALPTFDNDLGDPGYAVEPRPDRPYIPTLFETKFRERGLTIYYLYHTRNDRRDDPPRDPYPLEFIRDLDPLHGSESSPDLVRKEAHGDD